MKIVGTLHLYSYERLPEPKGYLEKYTLTVTVDKIEDFTKNIVGKEIEIELTHIRKGKKKIEGRNKRLYNKKILKKESAKYKGGKCHIEHPSKNNINSGRPYPIE